MVETLEEEFLAYIKKMEGRSDVIGVLSEEIFNMQTSEEMAAFIAGLNQDKENLSEITRKTLEESQKTYDLNKKIPSKEYAEYTKLVAQAETAWTTAREQNDFAAFEPFLTKILEMKRKFVEYWGYEENKYDTLLDQYEPGVTVSVLDSVFEKVRDGIMAIREKIENEGVKPDATILNTKISEAKQKEFSIRILNKMGFDFEAGRLDETVHPFATGLNTGDVRITTRYNENDFKMAVFGTIHEGGHAIYEQNFDAALVGTPLANGASMGIHESQSLFYEIIIGSSLAFWKSNYADFQAITKPAFDQVKLEDFYRAVNISESSLIRIEADTLTYPLHIMIRYELEKALINGELEVKDLPKAWGDKYEEYLGIRPDNDTNGVLQDIHWAGGDFGYFPSYALGLMYAAQFFNQMQKEIPNIDAIIASDDYSELKIWLTEHVHKFGKTKKPLEILTDTTGEGLNPTYLLDLLEKRYAYVYQFNK
ncbi:carboxypeptidase M32 [Listeria monocytogenes]|uniref:carboxypeptidase M32 n=1 Tax=Listeria monocytogenes TaxID=1639 RepID=UPI000BE03AD2|nr:carboxypeptidase M32 [Listeria monocytogenes]PDB67211.1 carboxypeptidase [Listeria monocytogenes]PDC60626.1 carboxypeptidase [Listeria monocytogenes]